MGLRAKWTGSIKIGLVTVPIKLFKSTSDAEQIAFNLLHADCLSRINMKKVCPACAKDASDLKRGYEFAKGQYVTIEDDELAALMTESTKTITIEKLVPIDSIPANYIESIDFIGPEDPRRDALVFVVIRDALDDRAAIGTIVQGGRESVVAVVVHGHGMALWRLRYASEVRDIHDVHELQSLPPAPPAELKMARQLLADYQGDLDMTEYHDRYAAEVRALIDRKVAGEPVVPLTPAKPAAPPPSNLMQALKNSLGHVPTPRPAKAALATPKKKVARKGA